MDFRRAQRNLNLMIADGSPDSLAYSDNLNEDPDKFSSSPVKSTHGTQIPEFDLSSDTETTHPPVIPEDKTEKEANKECINLDEVNKVDNESKLQTPENLIHNIQPIDESNEVDDNDVNTIFMNTQIQSRLDDANEKLELKSQLNQFKYTQEESRSLSEPLVLKPMNSITKGQANVGKKRRKLTPKVSRASNLMEMLSGKNKKVKDIIKTHKNVKSKSKVSTKIKKVVYDTYNEEEWNSLKKLLLEKFPENTNEDVQEMFNYVYGEEDSNLSSGAPSQRVEMWNASQQNLAVSQKVSQGSFIDNHETISQKINFMSLSQVMEDTGVSTNKQVGEGAKLINLEDKPISVESDHVISLTNSGSSISESVPTQDDLYVTKEDDRVEGLNNHDDKEPTLLDTIIQENKENSIVYDSMDENDEGLNILNDKFGLNKQIFYDKNNSLKITKIPELSPDIALKNIPLLPFNTASPTKAETIIDLTQGSFKISNELVSPVKSVVSDLVQSKESHKEREVQVPATRTGTFDKLPEKEVEPVPSRQIPDVLLKIKSDQYYKLDKLQDDFTIVHSYKGTSTDIVYDSYDDEEEDVEDDVLYVILTQNNKVSRTASSTEVPVRIDTLYEESVIVSQKENVDDNESDIWASQSAKDIRINVRQLGLKTARTKSEMVESLQLASQIVSSQDINDTPIISQGTKVNIFNHLSQLAKQLPSVILEKFYTFQPIPVHELTAMFIERDPFVNRIEEQTIKEWAEQHGISLRQ